MAGAKNNRKTQPPFDTVMWHRSLITNERYKGKSSIPDRGIDEEAASDRARIIYSSAFRRLQHKTQVFTLSRDAAVRTRLTHSLEVASVGRWVAQEVVDNALSKAGLKAPYCSAFVSLVEAGCLAHDIGNPPFGHFGESAIRKWFDDKWKTVAGQRATDKDLQGLMQDFSHFDGNPQGMRILTRLQGRTQKERQQFGMDLTFSQILTALKYPRGPKDGSANWKKAGFFESERSKIESAWKAFNFEPEAQRRFPLAYFVEAADDISYCVSDMEDGIDQGILTPWQFFEGIEPWIQKNPECLKKLRATAKECATKTAATSYAAEAKDHFIVFKTAFTSTMIKEAARIYGDGSAIDIRDGKRRGLLDGTDAQELLESLRRMAQQFLYPAERVQRPFLAGLKVIHGILDEYGKLLELTQEQFGLLKKAWRSAKRGDVLAQGLETFLPLFDNLPSHYIDVYDCTVKDKPLKELGQEAWEWFCRAHLIVDYLSGMADDFAHRTYLVLSGAELE